MTSRERLLTVLGGGIPDRVPVSFFVQEEYLSWFYPKRPQIRRLEEAVDCARELDFDVMVRGRNFEFPHFMKKSFCNWELNTSKKVENDNLYVIFEIKTPGGTLRQVEVGPNLKRGASGVHRSTVEYLIKSEEDFEIFSRYVPPIDKDTADEMRQYAEYSRKRIGDTGICVPWGWAGVYNQAANYRNVQELMMDPYLNPDFYEAYMKKITQMEVEYNSILAEFPIDAVGIQGNIANSGMVGKDFFKDHIYPYEKELVDAIQSKNRYTVYHNCGKAKILMECYAEMGLTAWETLSEAPQGDNDLALAKRTVGDRLVLIGNIDQIHFLKTATKEQIERQITYMMEIGKPGGKYIFAGSDFLERNTPIENVRTAIEAAKTYGRYE